VALDRRAVLRGEAARGDEAHHAGIIKEQNRSATAAVRIAQRVQRGLEHLLDVRRAIHRRHEVIKRLALGRGIPLFGDVLCNREGEPGVALRIPDQRSSDRDPDDATLLVQVAPLPRRVAPGAVHQRLELAQ
jgi:hypothetical protein